MRAAALIGGIAAGTLALAATGIAQAAPVGALTQLATPHNCITGSSSGCGTHNATGLNGIRRMAVSPDGKDVYVAASGGSAVSELSRSLATGTLTQLASPNDCVTSSASGCGTVNAAGVSGASDVALSPDGKNVYVAATNGSIAEFSRNAATGALSQLPSPHNCITSNSSGCGAVNATGLSAPVSVAVSPDGRNVYVTAFNSSSIAEFERNPTTGALKQLASPNDCVTGSATGCGTVNAPGMADAYDVTVSPDGNDVYVAGLFSNAVAEFSRNPSTGALTQHGCITSNASGCGTVNLHGLTDPITVTVSPDGHSVYVGAGGTYTAGALVELARNPTTGALTQLASPNDCITASSTGCGTKSVPGLTGVEQVIVAPDGRTVYATGTQSSSVAEFSRDAGTGALTQLPTPGNCVTSAASGCGTDGAPGLSGAQGLAISPLGDSVYVAGPANLAVAEFARALPPPVAGKTVDSAPVSGTITVELPGTHTFVVLKRGASVPVGTTVDATRGVVALTSATDRQGHTKVGDFYGGEFVIGARKVGQVEYTLLRLTGPKLTGCKARGASIARRRPHRLWGSSHGGYGTVGNYASATERGTKWLTQDSCAGTLVRVTSGVVTVRDFPHHKTIKLTAGHSFLAHPGKGG